MMVIIAMVAMKRKINSKAIHVLISYGWCGRKPKTTVFTRSNDLLMKRFVYENQIE